jgi:lipoyl(octanoyl) transferase
MSLSPLSPIEIRPLCRVDYLPTWAAMKAFTASRPVAPPNAENSSQISLQPTEIGRDQLWICEHPAVYTQGLTGKAEHVLNPGNIPVVQTDRGGQVTFHGPGQVVAYPLIDLRRAGYFVKEYVYRIEEAVIRTLAHFGVTGHRVAGSPGIYVRLNDPFSHAALTGPADPLDPFRGLGKIAALGIKVSRHCTYHGVALNVAMDLEPFSRINPCGYEGLQTTDLRSLGLNVTWDEAAKVLAEKLASRLAP